MNLVFIIGKIITKKSNPCMGNVDWNKFLEKFWRRSYPIYYIYRYVAHFYFPLGSRKLLQNKRFSILYKDFVEAHHIEDNFKKNYFALSR